MKIPAHHQTLLVMIHFDLCIAARCPFDPVAKSMHDLSVFHRRRLLARSLGVVGSSCYDCDSLELLGIRFILSKVTLRCIQDTHKKSN